MPRPWVQAGSLPAAPVSQASQKTPGRTGSLNLPPRLAQYDRARLPEQTLALPAPWSRSHPGAYPTVGECPVTPQPRLGPGSRPPPADVRPIHSDEQPVRHATAKKQPSIYRVPRPVANRPHWLLAHPNRGPSSSSFQNGARRPLVLQSANYRARAARRRELLAAVAHRATAAQHAQDEPACAPSRHESGP